VARVRRFLKPPREELEAMPFGQRMQYEMVNSFLQVGLAAGFGAWVWVQV
jgi:hypothetical protein